MVGGGREAALSRGKGVKEEVQALAFEACLPRSIVCLKRLSWKHSTFGRRSMDICLDLCRA